MSNEPSNEKSPLDELRDKYRAAKEKLERINNHPAAECFPVDLWDLSRIRARDDYFRAGIDLAEFLLTEGGSDG